jgi:hypothetical protein
VVGIKIYLKKLVQEGKLWRPAGPHMEKDLLQKIESSSNIFKHLFGSSGLIL